MLFYDHQSSMYAAFAYKCNNGYYVRHIGGETAKLHGKGKLLIKCDGWFIQGGHYWRVTVHKWYGKSKLRTAVERIDGNTYEYTILRLVKWSELTSDTKKISYEHVIHMTPRENDHVGVLSFWRRGYSNYYADIHCVIHFDNGELRIGEWLSTRDSVEFGSHILTSWDPIRQRLHAFYGHHDSALDVVNDRHIHHASVDRNAYIRDGVLYSMSATGMQRTDLDTGKHIDKTFYLMNWLRVCGTCFVIQIGCAWDVKLIDLRNGDEYNIDCMDDVDEMYDCELIT